MAIPDLLLEALGKPEDVIGRVVVSINGVEHPLRGGRDIGRRQLIELVIFGIGGLMLKTVLLALAKGKLPGFDVCVAATLLVLDVPVLDAFDLRDDIPDLVVRVCLRVAIAAALVVLAAEVNPDLLRDELRTGFVAAEEMRYCLA